MLGEDGEGVGTHPVKDRRVRKMIDRYLEQLSKRLRIDEAIAFGSTVRGDRLKESDVDLIIISEDFRKMPFPERLGLLQLDWDEPLTLEAFGYTPEELQQFKGRTVILKEALRYGKRVYPLERVMKTTATTA